VTTAFTYAANGNTLADGQRSYVWNAANQLTSVTMNGGGTSSFTYGPDGEEWFGAARRIDPVNQFER
jgi:YD repeat-containing protein